MTPQSFIFIGRSGCGKGTQAELLMKVLAEKDPATAILRTETGKELRQFIQGNTWTAKKAKEIYDEGGLMPEFVIVNMWVKPLLEKYDGHQHLIFDGTPRKVHEAGVLHSCVRFYGFTKPWVIHLDINAGESAQRLLARKRFDDNDAEIKKRLEWYEAEVVPTIEYYRDNPDYTLLDIDGARSREDIHADIVKKLGLE